MPIYISSHFLEDFMRESLYQRDLIKRIHERFPGCVIHQSDPNRIQGTPDLTIFFGDKWAMLEVKASKDAPTQPNQPYYVEKMNDMSFARFIYPENEEEVLHELQLAFDYRR